MLGFYVIALFTCLQHFNKFFKSGLEAQIWKGSDCRAVGYIFSETCWKRDFLSNTFMGHRWAQTHTNAFLLAFLHCFSGATLASWGVFVQHNWKHLWSSELELIILSFVIHAVWLILVFTFPTVRLALIFLSTHVPRPTRWRHCALYLNLLVLNAFYLVIHDSFNSHPANVYLAPIMLGPSGTKGKKPQHNFWCVHSVVDE